MGQAAIGGSFAGSASISGGVSSAIPSTCMYRHWSNHSSFCSSRTAPISRVMLASFGKMPTTPAFAGTGAGPPFDFSVEAFERVCAV